MDTMSLKKYIFEKEKVEYILNEIGCHHIKYHPNKEFYSCGNYNGDNQSAINVKNNEYLNVTNWTRQKEFVEGSDIITLTQYNKQCSFVDAIKYLHNKNTKKVDGTRKPIYKLKNGTTFGEVWIVNTNCTHTIDADIYKNNMFLSNQCGDFTVDLNCEGEPNTLGIDQYQFRVSRRGVIPVGIRDDVMRNIKDYCNPKGDKKFNGYSCGAWILEKGTMPWLWGKQVAWD